MSDISVNSLKNIANTGTDNIILLSNGDVKFANPNLPNNPVTLDPAGKFDSTTPKASDTNLGVIKIGSNLSIDSEGIVSAENTTYNTATSIISGLLSASDKNKLDTLENTSPYELPKATINILGGIKVGNNLSVDSNGILSASIENLALTSSVVNIHGPEQETSVPVHRIPPEKLPAYAGYVAPSNNQLIINPNSIYFNGPLHDTAGWIDINDHEDFHVSDNLTIECWIYMDDNQSEVIGIIGQTDETNNLHNILQVVGGNFLQWKTSSGNIESLTPLPNDQWNHVALTKYNNVGYIYLNGSKIAESTFSDNLPNIATPFLIGKTIINGQNRLFNGFLDEIRVSKTTRYLTNFTPATTKFTADDDTVLLIHGGDIGASFPFMDDTVKFFQTTVVTGPVIANYDLDAFYTKLETDTSTEVDTKITDLKDEILGGAGASYDTLQELNTLISSSGSSSTVALTDLINTKSNITDVYYKGVIDTALNLKSNLATTYTKAEVDTSLNLKSNLATTYTKTEVDTSLNLKANTADVTTSLNLKANTADVTTALNLKSNLATTYTKAATDTLLNAKSNAADVYTSTQVDSYLSNKADISYVTSVVAVKADQSTTYTKTEVDTALNLKSNATDVTTALNLKANQATTYTKTEVDTALNLKSNLATTYTKTEVNTSLNLKADKTDTYTKAESIYLLDNKADIATTYNKTEVNNFLNLKSNSVDVYTKAQVDSLVGSSTLLDLTDTTLSSITDGQILSYDLATSKWVNVDNNPSIDLTAYYTKTEVDTSLNLKANLAIVYTKAEADSLINPKADQATTYTKGEVDTSLNLKSNSADVYTKFEVDTSSEVDAKIAAIGGGASVTILDTPPANPSSGDLWTNSTNMELSVYYVDSTSSQWVELNADLDLSGYDTSSEVDAKIAAIPGADLSSYDASTVVDTKITALKTEILGGADGAHDTLEELRVLIEAAEESVLITSITNSLNDKADQSTTYTKTEVDTAISNVSVDLSAYDTSSQVDVKIAGVIDSAPETLNTLNELALALGDDANHVTTMTTLIGTKSDLATTYTKTEVDTALNLKANLATTYTKTEVDTALNLKANLATTYTKTEVDTALNLKSNATDVTTALNLKSDKTTTYTKTEVDTAISNVSVDLSAYDTSAEVDVKIAAIPDGASVIVSDTPPTNPSAGDLWTNSTNMELSVYYVDSTSSQWVELNGDLDLSGYDTSTEVDTKIASIPGADLSGYDTSSEVDTKIAAIPGADLSGYDTSSEVDVKIAGVIDSAPETLNTLNELALALGDDENHVTTMTTLIGTKSDSSHDHSAHYYLKSEVDTALNLKSNLATTYTKTEVDTALNLKANLATTYSKTEVDTSLNLKSDKTNTYTKGEVDTAISNVSVDLSAYDTSVQVDTKIAAIPDTDLSAYDTSSEVDVKISNISGGASVIVSDTPPANPSAGDLWTNSTNMTLNIYYVDSTSSQWVELNQSDLELAGYDTSTEVDTKISAIPGADLSAYDTASEVDVKIDSIPVSKLANVTAVSDFPSLLDSFALSALDSCKYIIKIKSDSGNRYITELLLLHDGTDCFITEYGIIDTASASWVTLSCNIVGSNVELSLTTSVNGTGNSTVEITKII